MSFGIYAKLTITCYITTVLLQMKKGGKNIFGGAFLLSRTSALKTRAHFKGLRAKKKKGARGLKKQKKKGTKQFIKTCFHIKCHESSNAAGARQFIFLLVKDKQTWCSEVIFTHTQKKTRTILLQNGMSILGGVKCLM